VAGGGPALKKTTAMPLVAMILATLAITAVPIRTARAAMEDEPWYGDMGRHWASEYVRILWEEKVTDGEVRMTRRHGNKHREAYYYPSLVSTRAQYAMMLAKAFGLQPLDYDQPCFADVPRDYSFFGKKAFGYIQASARAGMILGYPGGAFRPDSPLTREQAFSILVRALGLGPFADSLRDEEAARIVRRYRDCGQISPCFLKPLAIATAFHIIEGYPDGSLRPTTEMNRAESATVVYRSCMVRAEAAPSEFSPDGDGIDDFTTFNIQTLRNRNAISWNFFVTDYTGAILKTMNTACSRGAPPPALAWDGSSNNGGGALPDGTYYYRAQVLDRQDQTFWSVMKPVRIRRKSLRGFVSPPSVRPGDGIDVTALAMGSPLSVWASTPWSVPTAMTRVDSTTWRCGFTIREDAPDGEYEVDLLAVYEGTERRAKAPFRVEETLVLDGSLTPNPCRAGQLVSIRATASPSIIQVEASCYDLGLSVMSLAGPSPAGEWYGSFRVPRDADPGRYGVTLRGRSPRKSATRDLDLIVGDKPLDSVTFTLTG